MPWILNILYRPFVAMENQVPDEKLVQAIKKAVSNPSRLIKLQRRDTEVFQDETRVRAIVASSREHRRQGFSGFMQEGRILAQDWDFRLEDIGFRPIHMWYGSEDVNVPPHMGSMLAAKIGDGVELNILNETHLTLMFSCADQVLKDLLQAPRS